MATTQKIQELETGKINTGASPADLTVDCGTEKTIVLSQSVWDDIRIIPGSFDRPGTSDPVLNGWQPGGSGATFQVYVFAQNDEVHFTLQLPHQYKIGTDIKCHCHWTPRNRGNEENGKTVAWKADISWCSHGSTFPASTTYDMTDACNGVDDEHNITPDIVIDGHTSPKGISSMLIVRLYRDTGDTWAGTTDAQLPAILEFDIHYERDTIGSRQSLVK